jgi:hypothetical protein
MCPSEFNRAAMSRITSTNSPGRRGKSRTLRLEKRRSCSWRRCGASRRRSRRRGTCRFGSVRAASCCGKAAGASRAGTRRQRPGSRRCRRPGRRRCPRPGLDQLDHHLDDVPRRAELAVNAGLGDLRQQVLVQVALGVARLHRDAADHRHHPLQEGRRRDDETASFMKRL